MGILTFLSKYLGLTSAEGRILIFLVTTALIGGAIYFYRERHGQGPRFDFRAQDSLFMALSANALVDSLPGEYPPKQAGYDSLTSPVDLNSATKTELMRLPAVGESLAARILAYREKHGHFQNLEELKFIHGIGEKKFEQIRRFITLSTEHGKADHSGNRR